MTADSSTAAAFRLDGKTALVTGARSGIGRAIAVGYARAGADLVLLGRTGDLGETAEAVRREGRETQTVALDLSRPEAVPESISALLQRRRVDILVNNAGVIRRGPAEQVGYAAWREVMAVNLDSAFLLAQACGAAMARHGSGKIITIGSLLSFQGGVNVAAYAASKHAVLGMTRALANEWAARGVQVNAIAPGYIATENTRPLREDGERNEAIRARIPAGRWGEAEDIVGAAVFLAAPASAYVNGHTLVVDGGWMGR
ncbi:SDR family oxidoreductase [Catenulispora pinisilvae]|uniref:SDR family oxidoreductase n=1 Tax=Catenulispora pinisilvae TaxID=2705253 RepID=UPI0018924F83|nr:SDR family oxidoreductase [Catenulispora pinisilvae]